MYGSGGFSSEFSIKCVSGRVAEPKKALQVQTNIVIDSGTGFVWEKNHKKNKSWVEAIEYCENLVLDGYSDWRLPDAFELFTLMDPEFQSGLNYSVFGIDNGVNNGAIFWTSTQSTSLHASVIDFSNNFNIGNPGYGYSKSALMSAKCLRN